MLNLTATELPRVMQCNGSLKMTKTIPAERNHDTTARDEGIAAHWLAETIMQRGGQIADYENAKAPNGIFITSEMIEHVGEYVDGINHSEAEVETSIVGDNFQINSRADHISLANNILNIDDFKYGHRPVEVKENWTLIAHAIGFCIERKKTPEQITFTIYQPRARHPDGTRREWSITYNDLVNEYYAQICNTLSNPSDILTTGRNCRRCPTLAFCPAASAAGFAAVEESALAYDEELSNDELSLELNILKIAESRLSDRLQALEELAKYRLKRGEIVNGYAIEHGKGNRVWQKKVTPEMLLALTGKQLTTVKMMTPAAVRRTLKNDILFDTLTERPNTGVKLKRIDANKQAASLLKG